MYRAKARGRDCVEAFAPGHPRDHGAGAAHGDRAAAGHRARRDRAVLPADRRADHRSRHRVRGAGPLAAPRARAADAGPVPADGRGDRADRRHRGVRSCATRSPRSASWRARELPFAGATISVNVGVPPARRPGVRRARRRRPRPDRHPGRLAVAGDHRDRAAGRRQGVDGRPAQPAQPRPAPRRSTTSAPATRRSRTSSGSPSRRSRSTAAFVAGLGLDAEDTTIVEAVVNLGHSFGIAVIAEGLETPLQLSRLRAAALRQGPGLPLRPPPPRQHRRIRARRDPLASVRARSKTRSLERVSLKLALPGLRPNARPDRPRSLRQGRSGHYLPHIVMRTSRAGGV